MTSLRDFITAPWRSQKAGIGYPNPGWAPTPSSIVTSSVGVTVTDERARSVSAWTAGIQTIARDMAGLPFITYRRNGQGKDRAYDSPVYRILHDSPNPEMTAFVFREALQAHLLSWGNAYAEKELDGMGRVVRLWPLRPDRMTVGYDDDGYRTYDYTVRAGTAAVRLPRERVFHIPGLGFDGLVGYSPLRMARETLGASIALREYGNRVLQNDARPSVVLTHPNVVSDKAKANIRASWEATHGGFTNAGRMALLEEGITLTTVGFPPEDIQFIASQEWQVTEVARWLGIAPHKIGDLTHATFSNIEEQNIDYAISTLRGWCVRWEQQSNKDLLDGVPGMFTEHLLDAFMRGKTLERYQAYAVGIQNRWLVPNDVLDRENMNPVAWGDRPVDTPNNQTNRYTDLGTLIRAGFEPAAALAALGLPPIAHTGLVPVTVTLDPETQPTRLPPPGGTPA